MGRAEHAAGWSCCYLTWLLLLKIQCPYSCSGVEELRLLRQAKRPPSSPTGARDRAARRAQISSDQSQVLQALSSATWPVARRHSFGGVIECWDRPWAGLAALALAVSQLPKPLLICGDWGGVG